MTSKNFLFGIMVLVFFIFCQKNFGQTSELEEAKKAIAESNAIYFKSYERNEPKLFTDRYAKDACLMEPGKPIMCGEDIVAEFFRKSYAGGTRSGEFITQEVFGAGDGYVVEVGLLKIYDGKGKQKDNGKYLVLWKKTPEGWKMFRDAFSSNQ
ncbi:YybH family protein [Sinomicrobium sp. M5D2P9]